jgi:NADPH:quinone reductase-like Zn-dependent oxidoreductase
MVAVVVTRPSPDDPLAALEVRDSAPAPAVDPPEDWVPVRVRAASLNHHDVWSLRGVGLPAERMPMVLGTDAAGTGPDGEEVVVHAVLGDPGWVGDETEDPRRSLLSERWPGTFADTVLVPRRNLVPKPPELSFEEAACLPTAWLTAYRMLFTKARATPGQTVLVQGAGGGVATALVTIGAAAGLRVWVTSRDEGKRRRALELGAHAAFDSGARLPEKVDAVMETVGEATWGHSLRALRPGGTVVVSGATSGAMPPADLQRVFFLQLQVVGSTMGTRTELDRLLRLCADAGVRPLVDSVLPMTDAADGFARMVSGEVVGKVVLVP